MVYNLFIFSEYQILDIRPIGYAVMSKWEDTMPPKCKESIYVHLCGNILQNFMRCRERIS